MKYYILIDGETIVTTNSTLAEKLIATVADDYIEVVD